MTGNKYTKLCDLLEERNVSCSALAKAIGSARQTVINWCNGKGEPGATALLKIAAFFNIPVKHLFPETNPFERVSVFQSTIAQGQTEVQNKKFLYHKVQLKQSCDA